MKNIILAAIILLFSMQSAAQKQLERTLKGYVNPDELVTLSADIPFNNAVSLLSKVSESTTGKKVLSTVDNDKPIGLEIKNIEYYKALIMIVQYAGLMFDEREDVIVIKRKGDKESKIQEEYYASVNSRELNISAVFFEMDVNMARKIGLDWKFFFRKDFELGVTSGTDREKLEQQQQQAGGAGGTGQQTGVTPDFLVSGKGQFDIGSYVGDATAVFQFFESENVGEIIASPNITVRDGVKGRIQVGSDFSIKQRDFSGNIIENFFSTGSIIEVTPFIYTEEGVDYILLNIQVERSSFIPDPLTTEIRKTSATTQVLMLNNEEVVLGGLFINEDINVRTGVPFLKDLPWYVFGLRYIFGADEIRVNKKELVILLRTELVPTLKDRVAGVKTTTPIQNEVKKYRARAKYYQFNQSTTD
jgi:general secretion pathway protein D